MYKIKSHDELRRLKRVLADEMKIREQSNQPDHLIQIRVAMDDCGIAAGAQPVLHAFIDRIDAAGLPALVTRCGCMGYCDAEPTVEVRRPGEDPVLFGQVNVARATEIIERYLIRGESLDYVIPRDYRISTDKV